MGSKHSHANTASGKVHCKDEHIEKSGDNREKINIVKTAREQKELLEGRRKGARC